LLALLLCMVEACLDFAMSEVYATNLKVIAAADEGRATLEDITRAVCASAGVQSSMDPVECTQRDGTKVSIERLPSGVGPEIWRLRQVVEDATGEGMTRQTSISVIGGRRTVVNVVVECLHKRDRVTPVPPVNAPAIVRDLIGSSTLAVVDGGHRMTARSWTIKRADVADFADFVLSPGRMKPVVAFTGRDDDVFNGGQLAEDLAGMAHVAFLLNDAAWDLIKMLPRGLNVYGGAVRLWWPGLSATSNHWDHPLWVADSDAVQAAESIRGKVVSASTIATGVHARVQAGERMRVERHMSGLRDRIETLGSAPITPPDLIEAERLVTLYLKQAESAAADAEVQRQRAERAEREARRWQQLWREAESGCQDADTARFYGDLAGQVQSFQKLDGARLHRFELGPDFMGTVVMAGPRSRDKILRACACAITRVPRLLSQHKDHALRAGRGGPESERLSDGAKGRRLRVDATAPGRRLHYWRLPSERIVLASVNVHDDMRISP
jgi:hypothetical protein